MHPRSACRFPGFTLVDLLTLAKKKIETATRSKTTQKETATRSKTTGACMLERALACAPAACGCLNLFFWPTWPTRAPTICLPVYWVHIGRSTYPSQKKKIETATRSKTTQKETATRSKTTGACMLERALACAPAACGCLNFFGQGTSSIKPTFFDMYRDKPKTKYNEGERTATKTTDSQVDCRTILDLDRATTTPEKRQGEDR